MPILGETGALMTNVIKKLITAVWMLVVAIFAGLMLDQSEKCAPPAAWAEEWSEGVLVEIKGIESTVRRMTKGEKVRINMNKTEVVIDGKKTFKLDPNIDVKDTKGKAVPLDELLFPSKIRYMHEKGVIKEMILMEVSPR